MEAGGAAGATRAAPGAARALEAACGESVEGLRAAEPGLVAFARERAREGARAAFRRGRFQEAAVLYSQAIEGGAAAGAEGPEDAPDFASRAQCYLSMGRPEEALLDARRAVELRPGWAKGRYRLGSALAALDSWADAEAAFRAGLDAEPGSAELRRAAEEAGEEARRQRREARAQVGSARRDLVQKLRAARQEDQVALMTNQFKQSMSAPDWDMDDYEWRPSFFQQQRLRPADVERQLGSKVAQTMQRYCRGIGELERPRKVHAQLLRDAPRFAAYERALSGALEAQPGAHVLALDSGSGLLALMAARLGAGRVTCVTPNRMLYRMCQQSLEQNLEWGAAVHLVKRPLEGCFVAGEASAPPDAPEEGCIAERADILVLDWFNHEPLGHGALPALDHAARWLLHPGAQVVPRKLAVEGILLEMQVADVSGFNLETMNSYRWHPRCERVDLSYELTQKGHAQLSRPFTVADIDLQERVDAGGTAPPPESGDSNPSLDELPRPVWERANDALEVAVTRGGTWNAVGTWFLLDLGSGASMGSWGGEELEGFPDSGALPKASVGPSFGQGVHYLEELPVEEGDGASLRVWQDLSQVVVDRNPPSNRVRHAQVPRWHFDMVLDEERNSKYESALRNALDIKRGFGSPRVEVLDVGAGNGILSLLAARAGADQVTAVEVSQHMCDVGEEIIVMNGYADKVIMLNKDARQMDTLRKKDGTGPDMDRRADVLVFEVFDSGLIGEGALHLVHAAKEKLLTEDAAIVPMGATVHCMPINIRVDSVQGFDMQQSNRWRWRPDYEGVDLNDSRDTWEALGAPAEALSFDFYEHEANMRPGEKRVSIPVTRDGVFNAVVFWFDLQLDEENTLSTSPFGAKGRTWQQALQLVEEVAVQKGDVLDLVAQHDTYGVTFKVEDACLDRVRRRTGVPLWDPSWKYVYDQLTAVNSKIVQACAQNPLEYRQLASVAVAFGARPGDFGLDPDQAADFCSRIMS